ncbi:uncharacterized protein LY79DRAFT_636517 [Colletotrichum navitas]|uniref:Uncharacterized protein n=1 Tax=Colletotrichum navitas TaxID=681940 RepID=A0AAD8PV84_9PEZI|nr:uncharacterized protein LY79DRAFT_636517 [Colletotrichum navitas]KAK1580573.1 hypothetical protein LY79DRAFT_636517 [Colletotrichum navitas]
MKSASLPLAASLLLTATAAGAAGKPPAPQAKTTMADNFPWRDPFAAAAAGSSAYAAACEASATFPAAQYTLHDLFEKPPTGLFNYADGLKAFFSGREYPGGWAGLDRHMYDRNVLLMEYADVPPRARAWIEAQERRDGDGKGLFAVFDKPASADDKVTQRVVVPPEGEGEVDRALDGDRVAIFAPGALYHVLPLFVADGSDCEDSLADLGNYKAVPEDGAVVAWPVSHSRPDVDNHKRDIKFTVKAQVLKRKEGGAVDEEEEEEKPAPSEPVRDEL